MRQIECVLIIDDDETSVFLSKRALASLDIGLQILTATNGLDGLKVLKEALENRQLPDIILLDVNMQGMGGFDFLDELMKLRYINLIDTKIVLLTNSQNPLVIESAKHHLAAAYLPKPLTKKKLLSILD